MDAEDLAERLPAEIAGLLRFARTLSAAPSDAEDLVQDTVTRAIDRAESFRGDSSLTTWLHRIMHNLAVDRVRGQRETPVEDAEVAQEVERRWREDSYTVDAAAVVARAETRSELREALVHLPAAYRVAVVLHDAEGLTVPEVAEIQGVSLPAAKQRVRRGRMMLVSELARGAERREALRGVPLRCWDARSRVSDYLDGELDDASVAALQRHVEGCPTCPPLLTAVVAARDVLRATRGGGHGPGEGPAHGPGDHGGRASSGSRDPDSVVPPELARRIAEAMGAAGRPVGAPGTPPGDLPDTPVAT